MPRELRCLIVDDEALCRKRLRVLLAEQPCVTVVGECDEWGEAIKQIQEYQPDLVFVDVQMPGIDGFDAIASLDADNAPAVVFATASDAFALRAFEANAVDYLLKPFGEERLAATVERVRRRLSQAAADGRSIMNIGGPLAGLSGIMGHKRRFAVRSGNTFVMVRATDIAWVEAADNYVRIHTAKESHLLRTTISEFLALVDPAEFLRIHRSIIVNVEQVTVIEPWGMREYLFRLADGTKLTSSRRYRKDIHAVFGI